MVKCGLKSDNSGATLLFILTCAFLFKVSHISDLLKELGPDTEKDVEEDGLEENCWEDFEDEDHEQQNDNGNGNTMDQA